MSVPRPDATTTTSTTTATRTSATSSTVVQPQASNYTAKTWAEALLHELGAPNTTTNVKALVAWAAAEGGHWNNNAWYNPLNTTVGDSDDKSINSAKVKQFRNWQEGLKFTAQTLRQGNMRPILQALMHGGDAGAVANAVVNSPWGTKSVSLDGDYTTYGTTHRDPTTQGTYVQGGGGVDPGSTAQLNQADFQQGLDSAGFPKALLTSIPELSKIWDKAVQGKWWLTEAGQNRFITAVKSSHWYQSTTDLQQHFAALKAEHPDEYNRQLTAQLATTRSEAIGLGLGLSTSELNSVAERTMTLGLGNAEVRNLLAAHLKYKTGSTFTGQIGVDANAIKQMATNYGVSISDATTQNLLQNLVKGGGSESTTGLDASTLTDYFKQLAVSKYPHLQKQLDAGLTVQDVADPYKQEVGKLWEQDANGVTLDHPMIQKALQQPDGKGGFALMPMYQFDSMLKQNPLWLKTNNARDSLMDAGVGILQKMGMAV